MRRILPIKKPLAHLISLKRMNVAYPVHGGDVTPVEVVRAKELPLAVKDLEREGGLVGLGG